VAPTLLSTQQIRQIKGVIGLSEESSQVRHGDIFVACARDLSQRSEHIKQAAEKGAVGFIVDAQAPELELYGLPVVKIASLALQRGALAAEFYAYPSNGLECVGVTGTNGKTSIAYHVANLSNLLGIDSGYSGTLGNGVLGQLSPSSMTTPPPVTLQRLLAGFKHQGLQRAAFEISSHALDQDRAKHVELNVGVFSNLTRDHLDYHQSMEKYAEAKTKLFTSWPLKLAVINADDELGRRLITCCRADEVISFGAAGDIAWRATGVRRGMHVLFDTPWGRLEAALPVAADFAIANVAAAIGVLLGLGHGIDEVSQALPRLQPIPGRMQVIDGDFGTPKVIVDFAHSPDALKKVLAALAAQCRGRLVCVVGCGGDRDQGKRAAMGSVAVNGSDQVWFTSDNPRSEVPQQIIQDMQGDLSAQQLAKVNVLVDRGAAISHAIADASSDDVVLIAGKGHENTQEIHGIKHAFSDIEFVEKLFKENA
jgi:UDP-N-acetylmuramoyl-L-alanyl-D-glutamate--2,6-diaminopimelate ligase